MEDLKKSRDQLILELQELRRKNLELKKSETALNKLEEALKESQDTRKALLNAPSDVIWLLDCDGRIMDANETAFRRMGKPRDRLIGTSVWDLLPPELARTRKAYADQVIRSGEPVRFEDERDGGWLDNVVYPIVNEDNRVDRVVVVARDITQRKKVEEELLQTRIHYQDLWEKAPVMMISLNQQARIDFVSDRFCEVLGYSREEVLGRQPFEFQTEGSAHYAATSIFPIFQQTGLIVDAPLQFLRKDGGIIDVLLSVTAERDSRGSIIRSRSVFIDITERRKVEKALKESEKKLNKAQQLSKIGDFTWDVETGEVDWSEGMYDLLKYEKHEPVDYTKINKAIHFPDDLARITRWLNDCLSSGSDDPATNEYRLIRKDGEILFVRSVVTIQRRAGQLPKLFGTIQDITDEKRAEANLKLQSQILNNMAEGVYLIRANDRVIVYANEAFEKIFGYRPAEFIGRKVSVLNAPTEISPEETAEGIVRMLREKGAWKGEVLCLRKDGTTFWGRTAVSHFNHLEFGEVWVCVLEDITEKKRNEEERIVLGKLESTGVLAGGIAHDFNNLLAVILGNLDFLRIFETSEEEKTRLLQETRDAVIEAKGLTHQLITLAKGGEPIKRPVLLSGLIREQAALVLRGSQVTADFSIPDDLWPVRADEGQIGQVIRNLAINAKEALSEGGLISIRAENMTLSTPLPFLPELGKYVKVSVKNPGQPIAETVISKMFDPYFSTKQRGPQKGMGLGLTICRSIIQNHGGAIHVESTKQEGTTLYFYLPASEGFVKDAPLVETIISGKGRILVMDDDEGMRNMVGAILKRLGYQAEMVEKGETALESFRTAKDSGRSFDAAILDLTIRGGMGGKETVKRLLTIDPEIKAIVASGYSEDPVMQNYMEYGFKGALTKPFSINELSEILSRVMEIS
jgi:PAS domain S-box-containing protein